MNPAGAHTRSLPTRGVVVALAMLLAPASAAAQINTVPAELQDVGVTEHLNAHVPFDATFRDVHGNTVQLGHYFDGRRPVVLNLIYNSCPMLCNLVLHALVTGLSRTQWTVGREFDVVTISIDPRDGPAESAQKRQSVLDQYRRADAEHGWHFLTGDDANIHRVANALGFRYQYDARQGQYAHPAVIFLATPDGKIARYLYGIEFDPNDLRVGLLEASQGRSITTVEQLILFCYHYDPQGRKYAIMAGRVMQLGGVVTVVVLGGFLGTMWVRERARRNAANGHPNDIDAS